MSEVDEKLYIKVLKTDMHIFKWQLNLSSNF